MEDWRHLRRALIVFLAINICIGFAGLVTMWFNQQATEKELKEVKEEVKQLKLYMYETRNRK